MNLQEFRAEALRARAQKLPSFIVRAPRARVKRQSSIRLFSRRGPVGKVIGGSGKDVFFVHPS